MGVIERIINRDSGRAFERIKHPLKTLEYEYNKGKEEAARREEEPEYRESPDDVYERSTGAKKTGDALWDKAVGKGKPKAEPVRTERVKEQKPVVKNYYYGSGARTTKREASHSNNKQRVSRNLSQPNFSNVNDKLINASNRQTDSINDYNRKIRDMFG